MWFYIPSVSIFSLLDSIPSLVFVEERQFISPMDPIANFVVISQSDANGKTVELV